METEIGCLELAERLFEALKEVPELLRGAKMTPRMLVHEAAAREAILDWAEGRTTGFAHLPADVRALAAAFMSDFLMKLSTQHPDFARETWRVPAQAGAVQQAKSAVAQELGQHSGPAAARH